MEFIPMLRESVNDIEKTNASILTTDVPLQRYGSALRDGIGPFEEATRNPLADPYTLLLLQKDGNRDTAFIRFGRKLRFYELSPNEDELTAYNQLIALWQRHKDTPGLNRPQQTGATDNFLNDLTKEPYADALTVLAMEPERDAVKATNDDYRTASEDKRAGQAAQEAANAAQMRTELGKAYTALVNYIWTMANALPDNAEWSTLLNVINVVRKRYADLLARRRTPTDSGEITPDKDEITPDGGDV